MRIDSARDRIEIGVVGESLSKARVGAAHVHVHALVASWNFIIIIAIVRRSGDTGWKRRERRSKPEARFGMSG